MDRILEFIKNHKNKIIIILLLIFIIVIGLLGTYLYIDYQKKQYEVEKVSNFKYYALYENEKMGVIDTNGNILIDPIYENVKIPNPEKAVFICQFEQELIILNDKKETLFAQYEEVSQIETKGTASNIPYEKRVLRYKQDTKYGLIDYEGNIITKPIYEEIQGLENKESELLVKRDGKYGVINQKGATIIKPQYDSIVADGYYDDELEYALSGYIVSLTTDEGYRYGYINSKREKILDIKYNSIYRILEKDDRENVYLIATRNGQVGVVKNEETIVNHAYQNIEYDDYNDLFILERNSNIGAANIYGNEIIPLEYEVINIKGIYLQAIGFDKNITYFDANGNKIVDNKYEAILRTENENYFITITEEGEYGLINSQKEVLLENTYRYLKHLYEDYFIASNEEGYLGIINKSGEIVIEFKYEVLQKVDKSNMIEAKILKENITDLYASDLEKIYTGQDIKINSYEDYIKVSSYNETKYFDMQGNELQEQVNNSNEELERIGPYYKVYYGYGESYYTREIEEE